MAIPRLAPSNSIDVTISVSAKLRPYFQVWFEQSKQPGESAEEFALRILKQQALNFHISQNIKTEQDRIEQEQESANQAINNDIQSIITEVN